ncbi:MAG: helix-turn-helix transcriptional regulator [Myxococcales bacterium]|nr:helix-turn-helix transcriptional regulator [Myxococcales bacterium]
MKPRTGPGRTTQYRNMPAMAIPDDVAIPTCGRCKSEFIDEHTSEAIAPRLQQAYLESLRTRARIAIDLLSKHISQRRLEQLLGLSQGYLSRMRAGTGNPSPELVSHLGTLCQDPATRLADLERFWSLPDTEWTPLHQSAPMRRQRPTVPVSNALADNLLTQMERTCVGGHTGKLEPPFVLNPSPIPPHDINSRAVSVPRTQLPPSGKPDQP